MSVRLPRYWVYVLLSDCGQKTYTGQTNNLRRRLREHNAPDNTGYTRGRRWRLLATRCFPDRSSAVRYECQLKRSKYDKRNWLHKLARLKLLRRRCGIITNRDRNVIEERHDRAK